MSVLEFVFFVAAIGLVSRSSRAVYRALVANRGLCFRAIVACLAISYGVPGLPSVVGLALVALAGAAGLTVARDLWRWMSRLGALISHWRTDPYADATSRGQRAQPDFPRRCRRAPQMS